MTGSTTLVKHTPGLALAASAALIGLVAHDRLGALSPHVVAVVLGVAAANAGLLGARLRTGTTLAAKRVLRIGVALLGLRLSLGELGALGPATLAAVAAVVVSTFLGAQWLATRLGLGRGLGLLVGTGFGICGASAIAAAEPLSDATEEEVAYALAMVTLCGTLSIAVLPMLGSLFGLGDADFGSWVGAAVHDVGQVVATASTRGDEALKTAVVVKLTRVAMLAPLLAVLAVAARRRGRETVGAPTPPLVPLFVVAFLVAVGVRTTGLLDDDLVTTAKTLDTFLLAMGLFGLGANVRLRTLRAVGGRPLMLGLASWVLVAGVSVAAVVLVPAG